MIYVIGPNDKKFKLEGKTVINTTSTSTDFGKELSPFFLGPVDLYFGYTSKNVENAWQYSKVYPEYDFDGLPSYNYIYWAKEGWAKKEAVRYPMGKGAVPLYSFWDGYALDYITARQKIYIPLYAKAVKKTKALERLKNLHESGQDIVLFDFDGYHTKDNMRTIICNPDKKMGRAFVIKMILEGLI